MGPILREKQKITQKFHVKHKGVDLRCVTDDTHKNLPVIATERCQVTRRGVDGYGNNFLVVRPLENTDFNELKYIHIDKTTFHEGDIIERGDFISYCIIGGNSQSLHLHFETWKDKAVNPETYFSAAGIDYI